MSNLLCNLSSFTKDSVKNIAKEIGAKGKTKAQLLESIEEIVNNVTVNGLIRNYRKHHEVFGETVIPLEENANYIPFENRVVKTKYDFIIFSVDKELKRNSYRVNFEDNFVLNGFIAYPTDFNHHSLNEEHYEMIKSYKRALDNVTKKDIQPKLEDYASSYAFGFNLPKDAKIYTIYDDDSINHLKAICENNFNNSYKYFDGIFVSSCYNGFQDVLIMFKPMIDDGKCFDITEINKIILKNIEKLDAYYKADKSKGKRKTLKIYSFSPKETDVIRTGKSFAFTSEFLSKSEDYAVSISENRLFRTYCSKLLDNIVAKASDNRFIIINLSKFYYQGMSISKKNSIDIKIKDIMHFGITINGVVYYPMLQSGSQARVGKHVFTYENYTNEIEDIRNKMAYGAIQTMVKKNKSTVKINNAISLCLTSDKSIGNGFSVAFREDSVIHEVTRKVSEYNPYTGEVFTNPTKLINEITPNDGGGSIEFIPAFGVNLKLGIISNADYDYLIEKYTCFKELKEIYNKDKKFAKIFDKLSKAFQIRPFKGLVYMFPHSDYGYTEDFVISESMKKFMPEDTSLEDLEFEVAAWNKPKTHKARTNLQFLYGLNLKNEDVKAIVDRALAEIGDVNGIINNLHEALKFLGMIGSITDNIEDSKEDLVSKLTKILRTSPIAFYDSYVQNKLLDLVMKLIYEIGFGKIPVKGDYVYITTDLRFFFDDTENCLKANEYYLNGKEGKFLFQRSPHLDISESVTGNLVKDNFYWYLNDVLVFNPYDDSLDRAGGADVDGDEGLVVTEDEEPELVNAVYKDIDGTLLPCIKDDKKVFEKQIAEAEKRKIPYSREAILETHFKFSRKDNVGKITLMTTCAADYRLHLHVVQPNHNTKFFRNLLIVGRYHQGWEIDSKKTDVNFKAPDSLDIKKIPLHMHEWNAFKVSPQRYLHEYEAYKKEFDASTNKTIYESKSPEGYLYSYVQEYIKSLNCKFDKTLNLTYKLKANECINLEQFDKFYAPMLKIESDYRSDISKAIKAFKIESIGMEYEDIKKRINEIIAEISTQYTDYVNRLVRDRKLASVIAYSICYNRPERTDGGLQTTSKSFVWNCCIDGLLDLFLEIGEGFKPIRMPSSLFGFEKVEVKNNAFFINGQFYSNVGSAIPEGQYEIYTEDNENFINVPVLRSEITLNNEEITGFTTFKFDVKGFHYHGLNAKEVMDLIRANKAQFDIVASGKFLFIAINGKTLGNLGFLDKESYSDFLINKKVQLVKDLNDTELTVDYTKVPNSLYIIDEIEKKAYVGYMKFEAYVVGEADKITIAPTTKGEEKDNSLTIIEDESLEEIVNTEVLGVEEIVEEPISEILSSIKALPTVKTKSALLIDLSGYTDFTFEEIYNEYRIVYGYDVANILFYNFNILLKYDLSSTLLKYNCATFDRAKLFIENNLR